MDGPFDLTGRVALVTGGSRGLGRRMAEAFARHGADVMIASRKGDVCDRVAAELAAATGRTVVGRACHVGHWDELEALADAVHERFGRCDILVNNAGMSPTYPSLTAVTEELWDKTVGVNLKGVFRLSALIGERMKAAGRGVILNVSSTAAVSPGPGELPYAAAKAGVHALTVGLARAFAPEVRVNCLMPGMFATDISAAWDPAVVETMVERLVPLRRVGDPDEIVGAALYLATDASSYTTGSILRVDGGMTRTVGGG